MRVVVIGGSGHIGTFLVPRLVRAGPPLLLAALPPARDGRRFESSSRVRRRPPAEP